MISLFLSSPNQATPKQDTSETDAVDASAASVAPAQIADAMIRSMLSSPVLGGQVSVSGATVLGSPSSGAAALGNAAAATATSQDAAPALAPNNKATPGTMSPNQTTPASNKQLLNANDVPQVTAIVVAPAPLASIPNSAPPAARDSRSNTAVQNNPAPGPIAPLAKDSPGAKVAFTAILTPTNQTTNEMAATSASTNASRQASPSPPTASASFSVPLASAALSSNASSLSSQSPVATLSSQSPDAPGMESQAAGARTGGDAPSQQQGDSPETPKGSLIVSADTTSKAAIKQDNNDPQAIVTTTTGAVQDRSSAVTPFADQTRTATATQSAAAPATATPSQGTAEALRTSESNLAAAPQPRSGAAQEITIRIAQPDASPVDLRVVERSGQVHVDVRTPDAAMQTSLRQDLGTLTNSLQRAGYHTEMFTPSSDLGRTASSAQTGNQDDHQDFSKNRGGSGDSSEGRRQQQQQKRPSTWLEELEDQK